MYVHRCVVPARLFCNRILTTLRRTPAQEKVSLDSDFFRDINWFCQFLKDFNGVVKIHKPSVVPVIVYVDACLQGLGTYHEGQVYHATVPTSFHLVMSIVHLEMVNVLVSVRLWANKWRNCSVNMFCDNQAVVEVMANGRSRDKYLAACARTIWLLLAQYNIRLNVLHIAGLENRYADTLSRWFHFQRVDSVVVRHLKRCTWVDVCDTWLYPDFTI